MLGDIIHIKPAYLSTAAAIFQHTVLQQYLAAHPRLVIGIAGESGSGKSVTALCLANLLEQGGYATRVLHQDDYFHLPPADNHEKRKADIHWVGPNEVQLDLLDQHLSAFLSGADQLTKPLSDYPNNRITEETLSLRNCRVLLVEGTYIMRLQHVHYRVFMERNFRETLQQRRERGRDVLDDFGELVLAIEHQWIAPQLPNADAVVAKDYTVRLLTH